MRTLTLENIWEDIPLDEPVFLDYHMYDIPETMKLAIENAPSNVRKISFGIDAMPLRWQNMVIEMCNSRNIIAIFWKYPK